MDRLLRWTFACSRKLQGILTIVTDRLMQDSHRLQNGYANSRCFSAGLTVLSQREKSPPADHQSKMIAIPCLHGVECRAEHGKVSACIRQLASRLADQKGDDTIIGLRTDSVHLYDGIQRLLESGMPMPRNVAVVGQCVRSGTGSAHIGRTGPKEGVRARDIDVLRCWVECLTSKEVGKCFYDCRAPDEAR